MPFLPSLPDDATLGRIYDEEPAYFMPLVEFSETVMRGSSALSPGDRELIAAYTSGLNACSFCTGAHRAAATAFGLDADIFESMMADLDNAPVDARLKPILRYVGKLTLTPSKMVQADADAVFDAGWDEQTLRHAIIVSALFNFFNRVVDGHGVAGDPDADADRGGALASKGYLGMHGPRLQALIDGQADATPA